jgi:hypothetical protein
MAKVPTIAIAAVIEGRRWSVMWLPVTADGVVVT